MSSNSCTEADLLVNRQFSLPPLPLSFSALGVCVVLVEVLGRDNPFRISGKALRILKLEPTVKIS